MRCPHCHQPLLCGRVGIYLPPIKAHIIEQLFAAGAAGIAVNEFTRPAGRRRVTLKAVHAHLWQLEHWYLAKTEWMLAAQGLGPNTRWRLRRREGKAA